MFNKISSFWKNLYLSTIQNKNIYSFWREKNFLFVCVIVPSMAYNITPDWSLISSAIIEASNYYIQNTNFGASSLYKHGCFGKNLCERSYTYSKQFQNTGNSKGVLALACAISKCQATTYRKNVLELIAFSGFFNAVDLYKEKEKSGDLESAVTTCLDVLREHQNLSVADVSLLQNDLANPSNKGLKIDFD